MCIRDRQNVNKELICNYEYSNKGKPLWDSGSCQSFLNLLLNNSAKHCSHLQQCNGQDHGACSQLSIERNNNPSS